MTTITRPIKKFVRYLRTTRAVSALEYAILIGVVATAVAAALTTFSGNIKSALEGIGSRIQAASQPNINLGGGSTTTGGGTTATGGGTTAGN